MDVVIFTMVASVLVITAVALTIITVYSINTLTAITEKLATNSEPTPVQTAPLMTEEQFKEFIENDNKATEEFEKTLASLTAFMTDTEEVEHVE